MAVTRVTVAGYRDTLLTAQKRNTMMVRFVLNTISIDSKAGNRDNWTRTRHDNVFEKRTLLIMISTAELREPLAIVALSC